MFAGQQFLKRHILAGVLGKLVPHLHCWLREEKLDASGSRNSAHNVFRANATNLHHLRDDYNQLNMASAGQFSILQKAFPPFLESARTLSQNLAMLGNLSHYLAVHFH